MGIQRRFFSFVLVLAFLGSISGEASAAAQTMPLDVTAGDATWTDISDEVWTSGFPLGDNEHLGLHIRDADIGSTSSFFTAALMLEVKGVLFTDADDSVDVTDAGPYTSLTTARKLKGAKVTVRFDFLDDRPIVRALFSFKNPGSTALRLPVRVGTSLDSGDQTLVFATESGDDIVDENDSWFLSTDNGDPPAVIAGMGDAPVGLDHVPDNDMEGTDNRLIQRFTAKVKPGKTKRVLVFLELFEGDPTTGTAAGLAADYSDGASLNENGLLSGLTETEAKQVINWDLPAPSSG